MTLPVGVTQLGQFGVPVEEIVELIADQLPAAIDAMLGTVGGGRLAQLGGFVGSSRATTDLNDLSESGWRCAESSALNRPPGTGSAAFNVLHLAYGSSAATQIASSVSGSATPVLYLRAKRGGDWSPWVPLLTPGDLDSRVAGLIAELSLITSSALNARVEGLIAELSLVTLKKCVHREGSTWVWDGPGSPAATHYAIPDHTGALIVRATPFPVPSATSPALNW